MDKRKRVIVFFGLIASGKSYLAIHWGRRKGCAYYNSDVVRKELAGIEASVSQKEEVDAGIYSSDFSRRTYDELLRRGQVDLGDGGHDCVVLDGSYQSRSERDRVRTTFSGCRILFVFCQCSELVMKARMDKRMMDPDAVSDGRWEIYLKQKQRFETPEELPPGLLVTIDTDRELPELLARLDEKVGEEQA